ncbi:MAG: response regulator transcription factor [Longibaculum sp.]
MLNDILMIDDDQDLNEVVGMYLIDKGMKFRSLCQPHLWKEEIAKKKPHLILLDVEMPGYNGFDLCQDMRNMGLSIPIIFLTSHSEEENRIQSFETGGNDFMAKPFSLEELRLRIEARLKDKQLLKKKSLYTFGDLECNIRENYITIFGKTIVLTNIEMAILYFLATHPQKVYSEKEIYQRVWHESYNQDTRMVNVHISNIRKKIKKIDHNHTYIQTIWGKGYQFIG